MKCAAQPGSGNQVILKDTRKSDKEAVQGCNERVAAQTGAAAMRVTQVLYSGLGGHGSVAFSLQAASEQTASGWENAMVFLGIEPLLQDYERLCSERGLKREYVKATAGRPWRSWPGLLRALNAQRPDAILLHSVKAILPAWFYARSQGIPLVAVEHQANSLKKRSEWMASRMVMRLADAAVVLTPDYADDLRAGLGEAWRGEKVHIIPNGIDTDAFAHVDATKHGNTRVIGMASRFSKIKRHELLIGALRILREEDGPQSWRLSLAGDGETRAEMSQLATETGVSDLLDLPGFLGGDDLLHWFQNLDIYAHASDSETLSTSLLQAMAIGLPILGSDVPGIRDLLTDGRGILAEEETPAGFACALRRIAQCPQEAEVMGQKARAAALAHYSQRAMHASYAALLEHICAKSFT
jgi:glycosyltransferase involved in cell wall biosynthesis